MLELAENENIGEFRWCVLRTAEHRTVYPSCVSVAKELQLNVGDVQLQRTLDYCTPSLAYRYMT